MAQTEITVQAFESIEDVKKKLLGLGYKEIEVYTGEDSYFSTLTKEKLNGASYQELLNSSLIVRSFFTASTGERKSFLVFKKKQLDDKGNVISEEKVSTKVDDYVSAKKAFELSGLQNWANLNQQNSFFVNGEREITVGTVKGLDGTFIEIEEYPSLKELSIDAKLNELKKLLDSFDFKHGDDYSVKKVYMLYTKNK